ncbi:MAG: hypothetical protein WED34_14115 [Planctomycetales bacterium]
MKTHALAVCGLVLLAFGGAAHAQNAPNGHTPEVLIMQAGGDRLMEDLQYLLTLTTPQQQAQWKTIKDWVEEMFLPGIDGKLPIGVDVILSNDATRYRPQFPIKNLQDFRNNLNAYGIPSRKKTASLYQLEKGFEGYLRYRHGYAIIGERDSDVPLTVPNPQVDLVPLVQAGFDAALRLRNDPQGMDPRRNDFQRIRKDLLASVKQNPDETKEDFEVRRTLVEHQLNELERFYVESRYALLGWTTDSRQQEGRLDITLEPIAGSSLAAAIDLLNQAPSHFANVPKAQDSILSLRVNHPLDPMRKQHAADFVKVLRPSLERRVEDDKDRSDEEKKAGKQVVEMIAGMIDAGAQAGRAEFVVEVATRQSGKRALVAGVRSVDGNKVHDIVQLLPAARKTRKVQMDVAKVGETRIHQVDLDFDQPAILQDFYGQDLALFVGGDKDAVWFATGEKALDDLKAAIAAVGQPNAGKQDDPFVDLAIKLGPWVDLRSQLDPIQPKAKPAARPRPAPARGEARTPVADELTPEIDRSQLRKLALEAFAAGDDVLTLQLTRKDKDVAGKLSVQRGVLRMVGKGLAQFSEENLAE